MTRAWTRETPIGVLTLTEEAGALTGREDESAPWMDYV